MSCRPAGDDRGQQFVLHFSVADTGPGIPPDKQPLIFQAFSQADTSMARRFGGTGLGLTISAQLVALMGGRIWVESEPGKGATFHFTAALSVHTGRSRRRRRARSIWRGFPCSWSTTTRPISRSCTRC